MRRASSQTLNTMRPRLPHYFGPYISQIKNLSRSDLERIFKDPDRLQTSDQQTVTETKSGATYEYKGKEQITSLEQAIAFFQIDTEVYEVEKVIYNSYPTTIKNAENEPVQVVNYQVKVFTNRKKAIFDADSFKNKLLADISSKTKRLNTGRKKAAKSGLVVECMVTDHHLGKVGFNPETMAFNWTVQEAAEMYHAIIDNLLAEVGKKDIVEFILPTGNDLLNIDNSANTTTRGTPQMTAEFWQHLFTFSAKMIREAVQRLSEIAPVYIPFVEGNHDRNSVFALGEVISAMFEGDDRVMIDNTAVRKKYYHRDNTLILWEHGDLVKSKDLHAALSSYCPNEYINSKYRYVHTGHFHRSKKDILLMPVKEERRGIDIEICPTVCPTDQWHYERAFLGNQRRSKSFIYDPERGLVGEVYFGVY